MSDAFSSPGNTLCVLGEGWCLGSVCRRQDMTQKVPAEITEFCLQHIEDGGRRPLLTEVPE